MKQAFQNVTNIKEAVGNLKENKSGTINGQKTHQGEKSSKVQSLYESDLDPIGVLSYDNILFKTLFKGCFHF